MTARSKSSAPPAWSTTSSPTPVTLLQVDATQTLTLSGTSITGGTINNGTGITTATAGIIDVTGASTIQGSSAPTVFANLNNGTVTLGAQLTLDEVKVSASQINEDTGGSIVLDDTVPAHQWRHHHRRADHQ